MNSQRESVGIALSATALSAVHIRRGKIVATHEVPIVTDQPISAVLEALLALLALKRRWKPLPVIVALGPTHMQLRRLTQLPERTTMRLLSSIVRENPDRFFLSAGVPQLTTPVALMLDGSVWAASVSQSLVLQLHQTARAGSIRVVGVIPVAAVIGSAIEGDIANWPDGPCLVRAEYADGVLQHSRVVPSAEASGSVPSGIYAAPLAERGEDAECFAAAYGAAVTSRRTPLMCLTRGAIADESDGRMLRLRLASAACVVSLLFAVAAPGIGAGLTERRARQRLERLTPVRVQNAATERDAAQATGILTELTAFERSASSVTLRLASLTEALKPPTMLVSFRTDSTGGTLVAITPHADELIEMLEQAPDVAGATIVGPVLPEATNAGSTAVTTMPQPMPFPAPPPVPGVTSFGGVGASPFKVPKSAASTESAMERLTVQVMWRRARAPSASISSPQRQP